MWQWFYSARLAITTQDAVAQSAGGVFVSLPEIEEVEQNADINQRLLEVIEQTGILKADSFGNRRWGRGATSRQQLMMSCIRHFRSPEHAALVYKIFCV